MIPRLEEHLSPAELDRFLDSAPSACFYHREVWLSSLREVHGYRIRFLTLRQEGELLGLLPFAERRRRGLLSRESLPFGTYGGPVMAPDHEDASRLLSDAFLKLKGRLWMQSSLTEVPRLADESMRAANLQTQILDLSGGWDEVFSSKFRKERRRQVRKARREGVTICRTAERADLEAYYPIYLENVSDWGLDRPTPMSHFLHLLRDRQSVRFRVAVWGDEIIGGHLNFYAGRSVIAWNGTVRRAFNHLAPAVLLYADTIEEACAEGFESYNFGASPHNPSLREFKAAFGAETVGYGHLLKRRRGFDMIQKLRGRA